MLALMDLAYKATKVWWSAALGNEGEPVVSPVGGTVMMLRGLRGL